MDYITNKVLKIENGNQKFPSKKITSPDDTNEYVRQFYKDDIEIYESVFLLLMDQANKTIGFVKISQGGIKNSVIDIKIIFKYVVDNLASNFILVHNHPSGNLTPSESDIKSTEYIINASKYFDSKFLDHLIITKNSYYSIAVQNSYLWK